MISLYHMTEIITFPKLLPKMFFVIKNKDLSFMVSRD